MPKRLECDIEMLRHFYFDQWLSADNAGRAAGLGPGRSAVVLRHLRQAGHPTRRACDRKYPWSPEEIRRLYVDEGMRAEDVAERLGCSPTHVRRTLRRMGAIRPRGASTARRRGEHAPRWRGGRTVDPKGYVFLYRPDHPQAKKDGYVAEHRMVMSDHLGRALETKEEVHHINGVHGDNRLENLVVIRKGKHQRLHADVCRELWQLRQEVARLAAASGRHSAMPHYGFHHSADWKIVG